MMISVNNLQRYCRTCLVQLESSTKDGTQVYIPTTDYPQLEHLIQVCIAKTTAGDDSLCYYVPFLCRPCFEKWFDFLKIYQLAIECDEKIRRVLEKEVLNGEVNEELENLINNKEEKEVSRTNNEILDKGNPIDVESEAINNIGLVRKFVDDNYETDSPLLNESYDVDFNIEVSQNQKSMKTLHFLRNRKSRKSFCMLKKQKSRNLLENEIDTKARVEIQSEQSDEIGNNVSRKIRYKCEPCNKYFWEKNKYDGHLKQVHEGVRRPYQCLKCNKAYNLYKTLLQHKRECHSEKSLEEFKCEKCEKIFKTSVILKQHMNNKHSEQRESMRSICDQCGFIAAHQYSLSRHIINKHTETDQIKCDQCPKVFKTQYSLKYHVIGNHNPSNNKPFKCPECEMGFTRKTLLNQHKRTHLKYTERIKCDFEGCKVRFVKHGDKTHHMRLVHLKIKQHICDFCGEAFGAMQTLRHHRFIHTGEKPYKCSNCGQGFRQRTAMKTHWKTHFGKNGGKQDLINNLKEVPLTLSNS